MKKSLFNLATLLMVNIGLSAFLFLSCFSIGFAQGGIPSSANPGNILQQQQQEMWYRQHAPWLYGPITESDLKPPEEPVIEFHDMNVDAQIVSPNRPSGLENYIED